MIDFTQLEAYENRLKEAGKRVDRTMIVVTTNTAERMVASAKQVHPWQNRTGRLESDIRLISKGVTGGRVEVVWGVDSSRRGLVGAVLERRGFEFIRPAARRFDNQWKNRVRKASAGLLGVRDG